MLVLMPFLIVVFYLFIVVALIYLVVKRIRDKDNEDFEQRDN